MHFTSQDILRSTLRPLAVAAIVGAVGSCRGTTDPAPDATPNFTYAITLPTGVTCDYSGVGGRIFVRDVSGEGLFLAGYSVGDSVELFQFLPGGAEPVVGVFRAAGAAGGSRLFGATVIHRDVVNSVADGAVSTVTIESVSSARVTGRFSLELFKSLDPIVKRTPVGRVSGTFALPRTTAEAPSAPTRLTRRCS